ncbi:MAG: epoxyqueuosine reductase QueH [Proteobacteria bacterium]|nr:epoxyqueuosine reductase QueH [Pseudomonadota bacterium]
MSENKKVDYSRLMFEELESLEMEGRRPKMLLHLCCAPCSSYVIEQLNAHFDLKLYFYDPNIHPREEYVRRKEEAKEHAKKQGIEFFEGAYDVERWYELTTGHEDDPEKGKRCSLCYDMRLHESARFAREIKCDYFTTVLSISPHKDAKRINETGFSLSREFGIKYLPADFKKKEGFKKSLELSRKYSFYRQDYCGCEFSQKARARHQD